MIPRRQRGGAGGEDCQPTALTTSIPLTPPSPACWRGVRHRYEYDNPNLYGSDLIGAIALGLSLIIVLLENEVAPSRKEMIVYISLKNYHLHALFFLRSFVEFIAGSRPLLETHEVERVAVFDMFPATGPKTCFCAILY